MRWLVFASLAGCYHPAADADCAISCETTPCPDGLACDQGLCHSPAVRSCADAAVGVAPDAPMAGDTMQPPGPCTIPTFGQIESQLVMGTSYVVDNSAGRAVFDDGTNFEVIAGNVSGSGTPILTTDKTGFTLTSPRLTYDGLQLFAAGIVGSDPELMRSKFSGGVFQPMGPVSGSLPAGFVAGTVSETAPRHMVIEESGSFAEGTELDNGTTTTWMFGNKFGFAGLSISQPSLSEDGLTLVFIGVAGTHQIYVANRADLGLSWSGSHPVPLFNSSTGIVDEATPFLAANCKTLYYSLGEQVNFVIAQ